MDLMINIAWAIVLGFGISTAFVFAAGGFEATPDLSEHRKTETSDSQEA